RDTLLRDLQSRTIGTARVQKRYQLADESVVWVDLYVRALTGADGVVVGFLTQAVDITAAKLAERSAARHSRQLEDAQRIAGLGSFEQDPTTGAFNVSDELCRIAGMPSIVDIATMMQSIHPDDRAAMGAAIVACYADHTPVDLVHRMVRPDGTVRWLHSRAAWTFDEDGQGGRVVGTGLDITDRKAAESALAHQAFHDALTGLANKALFVDRISHALQRGERGATPIGVLFVDLDDFKTVNDALGHATGDQLLVAVAARFTAVAHPGDTVARFGGDDFAVLLESGEMPQAAVDMAARLTEALREPFRIGDADVTVRASIGAAIGDQRDATFDDLLRDADLAMYLAKHNGKGRFEMFRPGLQDDAHRRLSILTDLRHALDHDELEVYYQPIVRIDDAMPAGAEALIRWHHPRRGLLSPVEFIGIAESTDLIVTLGEWVLNQACRQTQAWRSSHVVDDSFYVSVNLAARQLAEPSLVDDVASALRHSGLPPRSLVLEITESALMIDFDAGLARLRALKELGLRLALDDYGTGYSSLNRLGQLPVDIVKIDKSFIDRITLDTEGAALVRSVLDVTSALGLTSIAEGVEQPGQRDALAELGCDSIQGYLFARPTTASEAARTLLTLRGPQRTGTA
ncbi:MAG: EAL domain-containing protein, partial [Ilumatobacteraceae bacterium]